MRNAWTGLVCCLTIGLAICTAIPTNDSTRPLSRVRRIIGGTPATRGTFPWMVSVRAKRFQGLKGLFRRNAESYCGGALIAPDWVLTAAHCLFSKGDDGELISFLDPKMWHVRMATEKLQPSMTERVKGLFSRVYNAVFGYVKKLPFYHVKKLFHYPAYTPGCLEFDIALLQLKEAPVLRKISDLSTIDLPESPSGPWWPIENQTCIASGWGCSFAEGPPTLNVQSAELPVLSPEVCRYIYREDINLNEEHEFCAGYHRRNIGICPGDSGGPLICQGIDGKPKLAGIVSATHSKAPESHPAVFTRVSYFVPWIKRVMKENPTEYVKNPFLILHSHN